MRRRRRATGRHYRFHPRARQSPPKSHLSDLEETSDFPSKIRDQKSCRWGAPFLRNKFSRLLKNFSVTYFVEITANSGWGSSSYLTLRFPDQIGAFRSLKSDCTKKCTVLNFENPLLYYHCTTKFVGQTIR